MAEPLARRDWRTRLLHLGVAFAAVHQIVVSNFMRPPGRGRTENLAYELHEYVGIGTLALMVLYALWIAFRHREARVGELFPWVSPQRLSNLAADVRAHLAAFRRGRFPDDEHRPLATAVHGLGLLVMAGMAATGGLTLLSIVPQDIRGLSLSTHELLSKALWAYLIGHAGMALLHELAGHRVFRTIFSPRP